MKNKLKWKKLEFDTEVSLWVAELKTLGWQFSIEKEKPNQYEIFIYYGIGEDIPMFGYRNYFETLSVAKTACEQWLDEIIQVIKEL